MQAMALRVANLCDNNKNYYMRGETPKVSSYIMLVVILHSWYMFRAKNVKIVDKG
jgi:hypothetical protein